MSTRRERVTLAAACLGSGALLCLSLPPFGFWPLAAVGLVGIDRLIADQPAPVRFRRGWLAAMGCFVPSLVWMTALTAPGYVIACAAYSGMLGAGIAAAPPGRGRWLALAGTWTLAELVRWTWPFGGVPLANLAIGQVAGPLAPVLRVGGALLLVLVAVLAGQAVAAAARRAWWWAGAIALGVVVIVAGSAAAPAGHAVGTVEVALVQGGGEQGTRKTDTGVIEVFERHLEASEGVEPPVDLVVWPEDVIDTNDVPFVDDPWADLVGALAQDLGAPLIVGTVEDAGPGRFRNSAVLVGESGAVVDRYDKVHRVPFGEYVPFRSLLEPIAGDALPDRDARIGSLPAQLDVPEPVGRVATPISWEIFFADRTREGVENGARLVLNPTNGSSFTGTIVQTQQIASSRMRAIESGRWVGQVAPTGFTAVIDDAGTVLERTSVGEQAVIQRQVELREGLTIYTRWGNGPALALAAALILAGWTIQLRGRSSS
ncbi:MAG: apolipoprotein N-acyltransferase [Acidimicrobiales bacterium]